MSRKKRPITNCVSTPTHRSETTGDTKMPIASHATTVPVLIDADLCIADKGCQVCMDVCPLDVLWINEETGKAHMKYDECWYCMPCETDCPTGAVTVPYLLR
jgi:NAD-dependent dihydropyrimidine dehydrogenase PreA subunit